MRPNRPITASTPSSNDCRSSTSIRTANPSVPAASIARDGRVEAARQGDAFGVGSSFALVHGAGRHGDVVAGLGEHDRRGLADAAAPRR